MCAAELALQGWGSGGGVSKSPGRCGWLSRCTPSYIALRPGAVAQKMPRAEPSALHVSAAATVTATVSAVQHPAECSSRGEGLQLDTDHDIAAILPAIVLQGCAPAGCDEVATWLMSHGLDAYTAPMIEAGYTRLVLFAGMERSEMDGVISDNKMPYPHARAFKTAVQQLRQPATASLVQPSPTGSFVVDESLETGLLASAPAVIHAVPMPESRDALETAEKQLGEQEQFEAEGLTLRSEEQAGISATNDDNSAHDANNRVVAKRWVYLMLCGGAVQQAGWWPLYGNLVLWGGLVGTALVCVGAVGFDCCVLGHVAQWYSGPRTGFWLLIVFWTLYGLGTIFANTENVRILAGCGVIWPCAALIVSCEEICRMQRDVTSR